MSQLHDQEVYEEFPDRPAKRRGRGFLKFLAVLAILGIAAAGAAFIFWQRQIDPPGSPGEEIAVSVPRGASGAAIANLLEEAGVISDSRFYRLYLRVNGGAAFKPGDYLLRKNDSFASLTSTLEEGPVIVYQRVTVQEGLVIDQILDRLATLPDRSRDVFKQHIESGALRSNFQPDNVTFLEGFLFPETYQFEAKDDELAILNHLVAQFDSVAAQLDVETKAAARNITPYEAFIVASLIERETRFDDERPRIARVIYNRLQRGMPLQIDATVIYALGESGTKTRVLLKDLEVDSPYNTYKIRALPPTPISNFGRASLEAALNPADGPELFYVVTEKDGRHSFASTGAEHQANIRKAERNGVR